MDTHADDQYRMTLPQWRKAEGLKTEASYMDLLQQVVSDAIAPALCTEHCEVEPDGHCEHGCPSVLLAEGLI